MSKSSYERVLANPKFHELCSKRASFGWTLSFAMLLVYYAFIAVIAFDPALLAKPLSSSGVMSVGIPVGLGVILFAFLITGIYVRRANSEFDELNRQIVEESK